LRLTTVTFTFQIESKPVIVLEMKRVLPCVQGTQKHGRSIETEMGSCSVYEMRRFDGKADPEYETKLLNFSTCKIVYSRIADFAGCAL
jgi:hypothetical protein